MMAYTSLYEAPYDATDLGRFLGPALQPRGKQWFVDGSYTGTSTHGRDWSHPKKTLTAALAAAKTGDTIFVAPGSYDETPTIARAQSTIVVVGAGPHGSVSIAPSAANAVALTNNADDATLVNLDLATTGATGFALVNTGSRLRAIGCKFEGDQTALGFCVKLTQNTVAEHGATPRLKGNGSDLLFKGCEFAWADNGVQFVCTDRGAISELYFRDSRFHNLAVSSFEEAVGSGGSAAILFRSIEIRDCVFDTAEDGTVPTKWIALDDNNGNTGIVTGCRFPTAINGGKNLVSTAVKWVGNFHTGGVSAAQPS